VRARYEFADAPGAGLEAEIGAFLLTQQAA